MPLVAIRRALISVSNKDGLIPFAKNLSEQGVEILSTGGTLKALKAAGIKAIQVDEFTGFPEILEGRVKTLHPKIHGGLLYRREKKTHREEAAAHAIKPIDLLVVNLYPFETVTQDPSVDLETAIENIDIGGPAMLRSAAKNHDSVTVVSDPADYDLVSADLTAHKGKISGELRRRLALKVFERTSSYDRAIATYLAGKNGTSEGHAQIETKTELPITFEVRLKKQQDLRYGENPHQRGALYLPASAKGKLPFDCLHGKELSFNNILDIEAALESLEEFAEPAVCVIKHNNPCGIAEGESVLQALSDAIECDSLSAFGGVVGINRPCTLEIAKRVFDLLKFFEVIIAPSFDPSALKFLKERKNLRIIHAPPKLIKERQEEKLGVKFLRGMALVQDRDEPLKDRLAAIKKNLKFVTKKKLEVSEIEDLLFAAKCAKIVKSNAIVLTAGRKTVGIGTGQMSRIDSVEIACRKAGYRTDGSFLGSDAFFPMPDAIETAGDHKIRAIIQPGGSLKDAEVIAACDRFAVAMAFTGERHFKH